MKTNDDSYDRIRDEKVKHDISIEPAKISALSLRKVDKN